METLSSIVTAVGLVIVAALAAVALYFWFKVYQQHKTRQEKLKALALANEQAQREQREWLNKSIQILAHALRQDELTLTEASIRIAGLLDSLDVSVEVKTEFSAFYQLREKTNHIPYLEAWRALPASEQRKLDMERLRHEASFNDFVMDAAQRIAGRNF